MRTKIKTNSGVTLIETIVGVFVFVTIAVAVYGAFSSIYKLIGATRQKTLALAVANEQLEIIRNLPYADVGIINGVPSGVIAREQVVSRSGSNFNIVTTIRNIDDSFDGTISGTPSDLSPADYKLVQLDVSCSGCQQFKSFSLATYVSPRSLELSSDNGAIFVRVFDANGLPISGANVHIENSHVTPSINIEETTNNSGEFALIDVPPGTETYEITVTKNGYSTEKTYPTTLLNPHPVKTNVTVTSKQATQVSFSIDQLSELNIATVDDACIEQPSTPFTITSSKLIGTEPDMPKYEEEKTTDGSGILELTNMEWDNYSIDPGDSIVGIVRYFPELPIILAPGSEQKNVIVITPEGATPTYSIIVNVKDSATGLVVPDASVTLTKDAQIISPNLDCAPTDHSLFLDLLPETYHLVVSADGYQNFEGDVVVSGSWQAVNILLNI